MKKMLFNLLLLLIPSMGVWSQSYIQVGTGTVSNNQPFYGSWNNTWTRTLYFQSELGTAKTITQLAWDMISPGPLSMSSQKIYMKHSTSASLTVSYEDPVTNGYTLVYSGSIAFPASGWNILDITDFAYNGNDNLIILVEDRDNANHYKNFNCTDYSGVVRIAEAGCDVVSCFPTTTAYEPFPKAFPNTRFYYSSSGPATPSDPIPADNATKVWVHTDISFNLGANTSGYDLYFGVDSLAVSTLSASARVVNNAAVAAPGTFTYNPTGLLNGSTRYFWRVVARNGAVTENSPLWKFTTQMVITSFPYFQGFEDSTVFYPGYYGQFTEWTYPSSGNNAIWNAATGSNPHSGSFCAYASPYSATTSSGLMSPRMILPAGYRIVFFWRNGSTAKIAGKDSCFFEISTNGGSSWIILDTLAPATAQAQYVQAMHDLTAYAGDNVYLRWRYALTEYSGSKYVYLDDISVQVNANAPEILLSPAGISFPDICIGGHTSRKVYISNTGTQNLIITGVGLPSGFACSYTGNIAPGGSDSALITFAPSSAGSSGGLITFNISGSFTGDNTLMLSGNGVNPLNSFFESFDLSTSLPSGWNKIRSTTDVNNDVTVIASSDAWSVPNCAKMLNMNDSISPLMMVTPGTVNFNTNTLKFRAKTGGSYNQNLIIGYLSDPYDPSTFVADTTISVNGNYALFVIHPDVSNTLPYIAFKHGQNNKIASFRIDDISWESSAPNPPLPASAIYPAHLATNVDIMMGLTLRWANGGGSPDGYRIYFGTSAASMQFLADSAGTTAPVNLPLDYSTNYFWQIIPYNIYGTDSASCPVWQFTTMADPTKSIPWSENFDGIGQQSGYTYPLGWSYQNLPSVAGQTYFGDCWDLIVNNAQNPNNAYSAPNAMVSGPEFYEKNNWLFSPPLNINPSNGLCLLTFWYKAVPSGVSYDVESLRITLGENHYTSAVTDTLWNRDTLVNTSFVMGSAVFQVPSAANYFLGFQAHSPSDYPAVQNFALIIDNVEVTYYSSVDEIPFILGVYPNPASDYLMVSAPELSDGTALVEMFDAGGSRVIAGKLSGGSVKLNLRGVSRGLYHVKVSSGNRYHSVRVVVQ